METKYEIHDIKTSAINAKGGYGPKETADVIFDHMQNIDREREEDYFDISKY